MPTWHAHVIIGRWSSRRASFNTCPCSQALCTTAEAPQSHHRVQETMCGLDTRRKIVLHICGATVSSEGQAQAPPPETDGGVPFVAQPPAAASGGPGAESDAGVAVETGSEPAGALGFDHSVSSPATLPEDPLAEQPGTAGEDIMPGASALCADATGREPVPTAEDAGRAVSGATRPAVTLSLADVWSFKRKQATWALTG